MSSIAVDVRGIPEVQRALGQLTGAPMKRTLQKASSAGAKALKKPVLAEAPRMRRLRKSISARQAARNRPAAVVSPRPSVAFYRHWVIKGTKPHALHPGGRVIRGMTANPFVDRGFERGKADALAAIDRVIEAALAAL